MIPQSVSAYVPFAALGLGLFALLWAIRYGVREVGLHKRPVLLAALLISALAPLYVALTWGRVIPESYVRFERSWATILGLAAMAFTALRLPRQQQRQGRWRTVMSDVLVSLAVLTSALAAAEPEVGRPLDRLTVVAVIDRSRSIELVPHAEERVKRELKAAEAGMEPDDRIGMVVFAARAATEEPPRKRSTLSAPQRADMGRDGTDIGAGIRRALAEVPPDSAARLVLLSDGVPTRGDAMSAAAAAVASEIAVDVVPLEQSDLADVRVVSLRLPSRATEGETLNMRVVVSSPEATEIELRVKHNGKVIRRAKAKVAKGEDVLRLSELAATSGLHRYDVEITALDKRLDSTAEDNAKSAFVRVRGPARALVLDGDDQTAFIEKALTDAGFHTVGGAISSVPSDISAMASYDVIVLGDIAAKDLAPSQIDGLASYVRDFGGGLLLVAGDRSMGPGGYSKTSIEDVSPVSFDLKQERRRASLAEVIGIDISGSMGMTVGGRTKLQLANEAAARSASLLGAGDYLGVEHVDTQVLWSVPLGPVNDKAAIEKAIRGVSPGGGGIFVDITLVEAYAALRKSNVNLKHVLLFADGADAENISPAVKTLTRDSFRTSGITTSCVALGRGSDLPDLEDLSKLGGGRFYIVEDASRLPAVFAQETVLASRSAIVEETFKVARAAGGSVVSGVDFSSAPALEGYVVTIPKGRATVYLIGPENDPILSIWSAGIGRAAAFGSDLKDRWGTAWTHWPGAARMIAQTARDISRSGDDSRVRLEADTSGGQLHLRASVVDDDGRAETFRRLSVKVGGPDGFAQDVPLEAAGAGAYTATVPLSRPGAYVAVARDDVSGKPLATTGAVLTAGEELRPTGTDFALLNRIAQLTGGKRRDTLAGIFADRAARRFAYQDITTLLLVMASLLLLLTVAARRLALPESTVAWLGRALVWRPWHRQPEEPAAPGGATAQGTLSALKNKQEERERVAPSEVEPAAGRRPPPAPPAPVKPPEPTSPAVTHDIEALHAARQQARQQAAQPPPLAQPWPARRPPVRPAANVGDVKEDPLGPPSSRQLTAAEILLARRKGRRK